MTRAPSLTQWLPLPYGPFRAMLRDFLGFHLQARERFGDVFRCRIGPVVVHYLYHPDHVRHVLYDNPKNFLRGWQYRLLARLLGDGILASDGAYWLRQRRLAQPAFHRQRLARYAHVMVDATASLLEGWQVEPGQPIDIGPVMSRLALAIASRTLFDRDVSQDADRVGQAFAVLAHYLESRFNHPFTSLPAWIPTPTNRRFKAAVRTLNELVLDLVRARRLEGRDHGDLLSMLLAARDEETGESMSDDQLCTETLTFLMAGHETTATALTWTWYLLSTRAELREVLRAEAQQVLGDRPPTIADVAQLKATRAVIEESMRLYPPIWAIPRYLVEPDVIGGFDIPAGSTIALMPFVTHRHPSCWQEPERFDPDRFTPERAALIPKGAYFPFLGGPHQCIGNEFAMIEMQLIVAMVLRRFDMELASGQSIRPFASLMLRPDGPVRVMLRAM